jgi:PAS domain S-box-containing protein
MYTKTFHIIFNVEQNEIKCLGNSLCQFMGYPSSVNHFIDWNSIVHPDELNSFQIFLSNNSIDDDYLPTAIRVKKINDTWSLFRLKKNILEKTLEGLPKSILLTLSALNTEGEFEKGIIESNEQFKILAEASFGGIGIHFKGLILETNSVLPEMTGYSKNELIGMDGLLLIAPEEREFVLEKIVSGFDKAYETIGLKKDGTTYALEIIGKQMPYKDTVVRVTEFRNIDDKKLAKDKAFASEEQYREIVEFAVDGFLLGDSKGIIIATNKRFLDIYGRTKEEVIGKHIASIFPTEVLGKTPLRFDLLALGQAIVNQRQLIREDGSIVHIEMHSKMMPNGNYQTFIRDITQRKQNEEAIIKSENLYRSIIENITDVYFRFNHNRELVMASPSGARLLEYESVNEMFGLTIDQFWDNKEDREKLQSLLQSNGRVKDFETTTHTRSGKKLNLSASASFYTDGNGNILGIEGTLRNITFRKKAEKELIEREETFRRLFENSADPILILENEQFTDCNQATLDLLGFSSKDEIIGKTPWDLSPESQNDGQNSKEKAIDLISQAHEHAIRFEWAHFKTPSGTIIYVEVSLNPITLQGKSVYHVSWRDITARKRTEMELAQEQFFMRTLMNNVPIQIYFKDTEGRFLRVNQNVATRFHLTTQEVIGKTDFDFFAHEHAMMAYNIEQTIISSGNPALGIEEQETWPDGRITWVSTSKMPLRRDDGQIIGTFGVSLDITDKKQAEAALLKSEERFRLVIDATNDAIWDWNLTTNKLFLSDRYYNMLGFYPNEFEGTYSNWQSMIHPSDLKWAEVLIGKYLKEQLPEFNIDFRMQHKDGSWKWIHSRGKIVEKTPEGKPLRILGTNEDITERKKNEEYVKLERAYFEQLFESSPEGIVILDATDKVIRCNKEFTNIFGFTSEEMIGLPINDLIVPFELRQEGLSLTHNVARGRQIMKETQRKRKDGSLVNVSILGKPIHFDGGQIAVYGIYRDITDKKLVEEQLVQKTYEIEAQNEEYRKLNEELHLAKEKAEESDKLKSAFLANMSHEIRTPMNGILGFSQLLSKPNISNAEMLQYINIIDSCGNQLLTIINDLIDISKIEANLITISESETNLNQLLHRQYLLFKQKAEASNLELSYTCYLLEDDSNVKTDSGRVQQIISNLIGNALKFTQKGKIHFGYRIDGNFIEFFVSDTGIGIPKEKHQVIFERFRQIETHLTAKAGGTGLGLSISWAFVEKMGGKLWLDSEPDTGSTFHFTIPYKPLQNFSTNKKPQSLTNLTIPYGTRILIAEDDDYNYMFMCEIVEDLKFKIVRVTNGADAVELISQGEQFDMLLLDLKMPVMDGFETARKIRETNSQLPIIAQTAYAFSSDREKALEAGCNDYLSKPIDKNELIKLLTKYLG